MKVFRVSLEDPRDGHKGYEFASSLSHARQIQEQHSANGMICEISPLMVRITKCGVLEFLNRYAGHPDNG